MFKELQSDCKIYAKVARVARIKCMKNHLKPSLRKNLECFIYYMKKKTNDLSSKRSTELIAYLIVDLATT